MFFSIFNIVLDAFVNVVPREKVVLKLRVITLFASLEDSFIRLDI